MASRALVIGLDCAAPQLVFDRWLGELPTIRSLTERGALRRPAQLRPADHGSRLVGDDVVAQPGRARLLRLPQPEGPLLRRARRSPTPARSRCRASGTSCPPTTGRSSCSASRRPTRRTEVNGVMVSCFLTPDVKTSQYTHPPELKAEIEELVGEYMVDVPNFRTNDKDKLLEDLETMTARRFTLAEHLLETRPWDLFFMVEMGTDRIHHGFWRFTRPGAPPVRARQRVRGRDARLLPAARREAGAAARARWTTTPPC